MRRIDRRWGKSRADRWAARGRPWLALVLGQSQCRANHLSKSRDRAENDSRQIEPVRMQPAVQTPSDGIAEEDRCGDDEADLGITRGGDQRVGLCRAIWIVSH